MQPRASILETAARALAPGLAAVAALVASASLAHHSPAVFDRGREIVLEGVVTEFRWGQPHSWIHIDVENADGALESWTVEMDPASHLRRTGWTARTVASGDRVAVTVHPLRNGERGGQYIMVELPGGKVMDADRSGPQVVE